MRSPIEAVSRITAVPTILKVITEATGLRLSLIAHVTETEWTCCAVNDELQFGLQVGGQLELATTLCSEVREQRTPIVISNVATDAVYKDHHTPRIYNLQSYISVPIFLANGDYFGNMCALDSKPTDLHAPKTLAMFKLFAELVGLQLDAEARHERTEDALEESNVNSETREQFVAVLGHDLRSPLNTITLASGIFETLELPPMAKKAALRVREAAERASRLVDDVLDLARGRLGGGIPITPVAIPNVDAVLRPIIDELASQHLERHIDVSSACKEPLWADPLRLTQLLQNLLANALVHSPAQAYVRVKLATTTGHFELSVSNGGPPIAPALRARMFEPYQRGTSARPGGLGLGLYIASQIVRSHRGTIDCTSTSDGTTIQCLLPRS